MTKALKGQVEWHRKSEKDSVDLAKRYAKTKNYFEAAKWLHAADFHHHVAEVLKTHLKR